MWPDHLSAFMILSCWHFGHVTASVRTPFARMLPSVVGSIGSLKRAMQSRKKKNPPKRGSWSDYRKNVQGRSTNEPSLCQPVAGVHQRCTYGRSKFRVALRDTPAARARSTQEPRDNSSHVAHVAYPPSHCNEGGAMRPASEIAKALKIGRASEFGRFR
jgi:hypothetical protein